MCLRTARKACLLDNTDNNTIHVFTVFCSYQLKIFDAGK